METLVHLICPGLFKTSVGKLELSSSFWGNAVCIERRVTPLPLVPASSSAQCLALKQIEFLIHSQTSCILGSLQESPEVKDHNDHTQ